MNENIEHIEYNIVYKLQFFNDDYEVYKTVICYNNAEVKEKIKNEHYLKHTILYNVIKINKRIKKYKNS